MLAQHFEVPYLHSSKIVTDACPGDWIEKGLMAPEPCASLAIERALDLNGDGGWILDGYPRSERQLPLVSREPIVFLELSNPMALRRAIKRGRLDPDVERYRITEQSRLLAPVRAVAAVIIPVGGRSPEQVVDMVLDWFKFDIHPK